MKRILSLTLAAVATNCSAGPIRSSRCDPGWVPCNQTYEDCDCERALVGGSGTGGAGTGGVVAPVLLAVGVGAATKAASASRSTGFIPRQYPGFENVPMPGFVPIPTAETEPDVVNSNIPEPSSFWVALGMVAAALITRRRRHDR